MADFVDLESKLLHPEQIAEYAIDDPSLLQDLLKGVGPQHQKSTRRENCSKALMYMAETWPQTLLPFWEFFTSLLASNNGFSKYVAIYVITSLAKEARKEEVKDAIRPYLALLDDESVMVSSHAALNAAKIAQAIPELSDRIIQALLKIDDTHHDAGHLGLVKAYVIEALDELFEQAADKPGILDFVTKQIQAPSVKAVRNAKIFLKKWGS